MDKMNKAVFVDRDGTIARDVPYCSRPEDFELLPAAGEGIRLLNESGFRVVVITNQSGIARGYFTEEMLHKIHEKMARDLAGYRAHVDAIYYCPHHPDDRCSCRKPNTGLLEKARRELGIDLSSSYFIGDMWLDIEAAKRAGCQAVLLADGEKSFPNSNDGELDVDFIGNNLCDAANWVIKQNGPAEEVP